MPLASRTYSRREFLRKSGCAALGTTGLLSALGNMRMLQGAVSSNNSIYAADDYRALVCLFLYGGNDANNMIVPYDQNGYNAYATTRAALAIPQTGTLPITPLTSDGRQWALHPSLPEVRDLFVARKLAILGNVGTLVAPITRAEYLAQSVAVPPQLFSHNDQQVYWQTSRPDSVTKMGWGGRVADLMHAVNVDSQISMSISLAGTNVFQTGKEVFQYQVGTGGTIALNAYKSLGNSAVNARYQATLDLINKGTGNLFESEFSQVSRRAIDNNAILSTALASAQVSTVFPTGKLGDQLKMIARLISLNQTLGFKRQIFFCALGGWDTHDDQLNDQALLLMNLSQSMSAFYDATSELGLADKVTTFTASDFGRSYGVNGDGTDHGWGSNHFVMGGAVKGGDIYGNLPNLAVNGPDDTSKGRWIPGVSVDEYSSTLAKWFGVQDSDMTTILPNIGRFAARDLGFMNNA